jgi:16S rRNA (guanine966-N2)-methyltransferase
MRIIGGRFRGVRLASVGKGDASAHLRPTTDRVRENLFNLLINGGYGNPVAGARVLDLFAGTGALGLEALSRGAEFALFIDQGAAARTLIRRNINILQVADITKLSHRDATKPGPVSGPAFDLVFLDPPYGKGLGEKALAASRDGGWLRQGTMIIWEENTSQIVPTGFEMHDARRYGDTWVHVLTFTG